MASKQVMVEKWKKDIKRLQGLLGTDEGFYSLALHSFIENYINQSHRDALYSDRFPEKVDVLESHLARNPPKERDWRRTLVRIRKDHNTTNGVRHNFKQVSQEEANAISYNFIKFCRIAGIEVEDGLKQLENKISVAWDERIPPLEQREKLKSMQILLMLAQRKSKQYAEQIEELQVNEAEIAQLRKELAEVRRVLENKSATAETRKSRITELRHSKRELETKLREAQAKAEELEPVREHLENMERLSNYSRTRRDYERSILKLTPEQNDVLSKITLSHDYLVKGSAGTGKSLVLLKALARAFELKTEELGFEESASHQILLLTYTTTLVRYNQYLSDIMQETDLNSVIMTSDSLFRSKLKQINPNYEIDYALIKELVKKYNSTDFLSDRGLLTEIEEFIFGGAILKEEYLDQRIARKGLKLPLNQRQRGEVWGIAEAIIAEMEEHGVFSKNFSRLKILRYLQEHPDDREIRDISFIFLDEAQDLTAAELLTLKALANRPLIMAGDIDQSIYGFSSPYARAGIQLQGRSKILKLNFRNTVAIHQFADYYRSASDEIDFDAAQESQAFREGPVPELIEDEDKERLFELMVKKALLFIEELGYDPENISILAPTKREIKRFREAFEARGYRAANIKDPDFDFSQENVIKLSTLHSSKGVDFPVVLLYLTYLPPMKDVDEFTLNKMYHNLIYVACTRAMDHLSIGIKPSSKYAAIRDLRKAYERLAEEYEEGYRGE